MQYRNIGSMWLKLWLSVCLQTFFLNIKKNKKSHQSSIPWLKSLLEKMLEICWDLCRKVEVGVWRATTLFVIDITVQQNSTLHHYVQNNNRLLSQRLTWLSSSVSSHEGKMQNKLNTYICWNTSVIATNDRMWVGMFRPVFCLSGRPSHSEWLSVHLSSSSGARSIHILYRGKICSSSG